MTTEQIHGHEVMHMMLEDGRVYTKAALRAAIAERFGEEAGSSPAPPRT